MVAIDTAAGSILRGLFHLMFSPPESALGAPTLLRSFWIGAKFDARLAVLVALPLLALGGLRPLSPFASPRARAAWLWYLVLSHAALVLAYLVDFGHYAYTGARLNVTVLQFLADLGTSARMVWQSYPVIPGAIGVVLAAALLHRGWGALLGRAADMEPAPGGRLRRAGAAAAAVALLLGAAYGKLSWYPLRWSDAFFSPDDYAADLALNPVLFLIETAPKDPAAYDLGRVREAYPLVARHLGVDAPDAERLRFGRRRPPLGSPGRSPNVVVVLLESFAAYKTGAFGNPLDPTPNFDRLAREGVLFTRFYTPTWGTARSVFATVTGLPDVETHKTATRNPLLVAQHTILNDFAGYRRYYFLGGSLSWANIRGLLAHNIQGLRIFEEGSYGSPRVDVWGISDLDLFLEATAELSRGAGPFVAIIQTSGSHRPYSIPEDSGGFEPRPVADEVAVRHGFVSAAEYNAFRFLDHGIGRFFEAAAREPWFGDTIFLLYGDHGLPGSAPHIPPADEKLGLTHFHVPLLVWSVGLTGPPRRVAAVASELDVLPTAASLAGLTVLNTTLGRDLLDPAFDGSRFAFTVGDRRLALVGRRRVFSMFVDGSRPHLGALDRGDPHADLSTREPKRAARMERLLRGLYETARYLPYVNSPERVRRQLGTE